MCFFKLLRPISNILASGFEPFLSFEVTACLAVTIRLPIEHSGRAALTGRFRHVTLLGSVFRYLLSYATFNYYSGAAQVSYRLAFVSAAATYGIVVYKGHIARGRLQGSLPNVALKLAGDENVQYLGE